MRTLFLFLLLLALPATAQEQLRSRPNDPAPSSQLPPTEPRPDRGNQPQAAPGHPDSRTGADDARTTPPPDHRVLGGPQMPGARQPDSSGGIAPRSDPIPPDIGQRIRPEGTTTGR